MQKVLAVHKGFCAGGQHGTLLRTYGCRTRPGKSGGSLCDRETVSWVVVATAAGVVLLLHLGRHQHSCSCGTVC